MTHDELLLFGERIRRRRTELALTQEHVSEMVGISLRFYQMIERGEKSVSLETLMNLSIVLAVSTEYLLFGRLPNDSGNPITEALNKLSGRQRDNAIKILQLYCDTCEGQSST